MVSFLLVGSCNSDSDGFVFCFCFGKSFTCSSGSHSIELEGVPMVKHVRHNILGQFNTSC